MSISTSYFTKALSEANTAITVALNDNLSPNDAAQAAMPIILQSLVDIPKERFAMATATTGIIDKPVVMDGTLTPFSNLIVIAAAIVLNDAFGLKAKVDMPLTESEAQDLALTVWKQNTFVAKSAKLRTSGMKADPNAVVEDGCGGACSI